jgi:hypothetical protein
MGAARLFELDPLNKSFDRCYAWGVSSPANKARVFNLQLNPSLTSRNGITLTHYDCAEYGFNLFLQLACVEY